MIERDGPTGPERDGTGADRGRDGTSNEQAGRYARRASDNVHIRRYKPQRRGRGTTQLEH